MATVRSSSLSSVANFRVELISDEDLLRGFLLDLGASGRKDKTLFIYGDSVRRLSAFRRAMGRHHSEGQSREPRGRTRPQGWRLSLEQEGGAEQGLRQEPHPVPAPLPQ